MKAQFKILSLLITTAVCTSVQASDLPKKEHTLIKFNNMIDANNMQKNELQKSVADKMAVQPEEAAAADQQKVLDLVDVEVGVGEKRPVAVDRRYNSIGEAVVDQSFSNAKVQLVDDKKEDQGT